jgi:hypothetical protein
MKHCFRSVAISIWIIVATFTAIFAFSASHFLLALIASHIVVSKALFLIALSLCYILPLAILACAAFLLWRLKLPGV